MFDSAFRLATEEKFSNPGQQPKYYSELEEDNPAKLAMNEVECVKFYKYLYKLTLPLSTKQLILNQVSDITIENDQRLWPNREARYQDLQSMNQPEKLEHILNR